MSMTNAKGRLVPSSTTDTGRLAGVSVVAIVLRIPSWFLRRGVRRRPAGLPLARRLRLVRW